MANYASVTRLTQTGFNEGIQELNVYMDNDTAIPQQWKWPDCRNEGDAGSFSLHTFTCGCSKQVWSPMSSTCS